MEDSESAFEPVALTRLTNLNAVITGIVAGSVFGLGVFVTTNFLVIKGGPVVGPHMALLAQFFIGYTVTFLGSLVGLAYGFATGFVMGYFVVRLYNWLATLREGRRSLRSPGKPHEMR